MKSITNQLSEGMFQGIGIGLGFLITIGTAGLFATTIAGNVNTFTSGELISASKINENFASLKTAIEETKLGSWETRSVNTNYLAASDGIVTAFNGGAIGIIGYTDSSSTPTIIRTLNQGNATTGDTAITMPVRKGDYWRVDSTSSTVYWLPLGN